MHSSIAIANYFLKLAEREKEKMTHMRLQKLVYIAHGWYLGLYEEPILSETVEAWRWGPVFPVLYAEFKHYGSASITTPGTVPMNDNEEEEVVQEDDLKEFLGVIWDRYKEYEPMELSSLTHQPGTPWQQTMGADPQNKYKFPSNLVIPIDSIKRYYKDLYEKLAAKDKEVTGARA